MKENVLVLNRSYMPINIISAKKAFKKVFNYRAEIVHIQDGQYISFDFHNWVKYSKELDYPKFLAGSFEFAYPKVIRVLHFDRIHKRKKIKLTRRNLALRDNHRCAYCGETVDFNHCTMDHILPMSRGGKTEWTNIILACKKCNARKGDRTPEEWGTPLLFKPSYPNFDYNKYHNIDIREFSLQ